MTTRRGYKEIFQEFFDEFIDLGMDEDEAGIEAYKKMQDALDPGNYNDPFKAEGGRVGLQEGGEADAANRSYDDIVKDIIAGYPEGDTQTIQRPSPYIEALQSAFGPFLASFLGTRIDPRGGTNMFGQTYGSFLPQVAAQDPASLQAYQMAVRQAMGGPGSGRAEGVAGFQPFLDRATTLANQAQEAARSGQGAGLANFQRASDLAGLAGQAARAGQDAGMQDLMGARGTIDDMLSAARAGQGAGEADFAAARRLSGGQGFDEFMSPYQQEVIDATMAQLQEELGAQQAALGTSAGSAFGGGRFGVAQGQLAAQGALNKALTGAQLRAQGFSQAQQAASRAAAQRLGIGQAAMQQAGQNVALFQPTLAGQFQAGQQAMQQAGQNVGMLGQAGGFQAGISGLQNQQLQNQLSQLGGLAAQQQGLGEFGTRMLGNQINTLTQMGQQSQAYQQALLDAQRASLREQAFAGQQGLGFLGQMLGSAYGAPGMTTFTTTPDPSTFQTLFGAGTGILGILGAGGFFDRSGN